MTGVNRITAQSRRMVSERARPKPTEKAVGMPEARVVRQVAIEGQTDGWHDFLDQHGWGWYHVCYG